MKIEDIRALVELKSGVDLSNPSRKREYVYCRAIYFKLCRTLTKSTLGAIGRSVGRDHASVLHGVKTYDNIICQGYEPEFNRIYHSCKRKLRGDIKVEKAILSSSLDELKEYVRDVSRRINELEEVFSSL